MTEATILVVTSPEIPGKRIVRTLGLVAGNTLRARHIGKDIMARFCSFWQAAWK